MADYNGTDEDDIIDASELSSDIKNIYPGKGNDTVTNLTFGQILVSSPGEDTISGINFVDTVKIDVTDYIDSGVYLRFHILFQLRYQVDLTNNLNRFHQHHVQAHFYRGY